MQASGALGSGLGLSESRSPATSWYLSRAPGFICMRLSNKPALGFVLGTKKDEKSCPCSQASGRHRDGWPRGRSHRLWGFIWSHIKTESWPLGTLTAPLLYGRKLRPNSQGLSSRSLRPILQKYFIQTFLFCDSVCFQGDSPSPGHLSLTFLS